MTAAIGLILLFGLAFAACWPLLSRVDNRLEDDMLTDPRESFQDSVRAWLGIGHIHEHLRRIEAHMSQMTDLFNGLVAQQEATSAAQASSFHNIDVAFQELKDAIGNGDVTPEVQAAADKLSAGFAALQKAAEDEGKLYAPADDSGNQGGDTPPADGGDTPVDNGGGVVDEQPVDDSGR